MEGKGGGGLLEPALERSPPTEAVAMIDPEGEGLDDEVRSMAFAACLVPTKTLYDSQK